MLMLWPIKLRQLKPNCNKPKYFLRGHASQMTNALGKQNLNGMNEVDCNKSAFPIKNQ